MVQTPTWRGQRALAILVEPDFHSYSHLDLSDSATRPDSGKMWVVIAVIMNHDADSMLMEQCKKAVGSCRGFLQNHHCPPPRPPASP